MRSQIWTLLALCAVSLAAPSLPFSSSQAQKPAQLQLLSEYMNMLGQEVQAGKQMSSAPVCNFENAKMPSASPTPLPPVSPGLKLKHVAIGRGTQNYTCANTTATPVAVGANATLFNASCIAATYPDLLTLLPSVALEFDLSSSYLAPTDLGISGHHFFTNLTTPFFNLQTSAMDLGSAPCAKNSSVNAPADAVAGQNGVGDGAVPWLKLLARDGATGAIEEVYRLNTAGGNPPKTCEGQLELFDVQYAAEYWFYEGSSP